MKGLFLVNEREADRDINMLTLLLYLVYDVDVVNHFDLVVGFRLDIFSSSFLFVFIAST